MKTSASLVALIASCFNCSPNALKSTSVSLIDWLTFLIFEDSSIIFDEVVVDLVDEDSIIGSLTVEPAVLIGNLDSINLIIGVIFFFAASIWGP